MNLPSAEKATDDKTKGGLGGGIDFTEGIKAVVRRAKFPSSPFLTFLFHGIVDLNVAKQTKQTWREH